MTRSPLFPAFEWRGCAQFFLCVFGFSVFFLATHVSAAEPNWRVLESSYPTMDIPVVGYSVLEFGAVPDGRTDSTEAFQAALDAMAGAGGGTVFAPAGKYLFKGNLEVPRSVILRGEWKKPSPEDPTVAGTILMPTGNKGQSQGQAFILLDLSSGIKDLSIWYPNQNARKPFPYPYTLEQKGGNNATFENLTLVNAYQGIKIGPESNELHYVHNVFGSPLKTGIRYDSTTDIGRLEQVYFAPYYWSGSDLPGAPEESFLQDWLLGNATGIHMLRSDWEYVDQVSIEGYKTGFMCTRGKRGAANAQFRRLNISNCGTALYVEKTNPYGMVFTECSFQGNEYGIHLSKIFDSVILLSNCILKSEKAALRSDGNGVVLMEQCSIESGNISLDRGTLSMIGCAVNDSEARILVGSDVSSVMLAGNDFVSGDTTVQSRGQKGIVQISKQPVNLLPFPEYGDRPDRTYQPLGSEFRVVTPASSGDDTSRLQEALDAVASLGGGIVFLPGGNYRVEGNLTVPSGVELRGVHDVPHHTSGSQSIIHVYARNDSPAIIMQAKSGLRGLGFNYPEQDIRNLKPYPFLIQGRGEDIYIINVNAANPYRYLDLMSYRCDNHFVDYLSGSPLKTGVAIGGGSVQGEVRNIQYNQHYWSRAPKENPYFANRTQGGIFRGTSRILWEYQKENLDALVVADTVDQFLYQNFVYGSLYGIRFTEQDGKGPRNLISHGHGTDGSKVGVFFESGGDKISMVNSELVAMSSTDKTAIKLGPDFNGVASLINTMVWGQPNLLAEVDSGKLILQNLHANRHGNGLKLNAGQVFGSNLNFFQNTGRHIQAGSKSKAKLTGVVAAGPLRKSNSKNATVLLKTER
ncbi:MAG: glycosyl hydrolase family 28-related protein [Verrucomicrobiota bacterium]